MSQFDFFVDTGGARYVPSTAPSQGGSDVSFGEGGGAVDPFTGAEMISSV